MYKQIYVQLMDIKNKHNFSYDINHTTLGCDIGDIYFWNLVDNRNHAPIRLLGKIIRKQLIHLGKYYMNYLVVKKEYMQPKNDEEVINNIRMK